MVQVMLQNRKNDIINWTREGRSTSYIAKELDCNPGSIWLFLKENNIETNIKRSENYGTVEERKQEIVDRFNLGESAYKISKELKISKQVILKYLKKWGYDTSKLAKLDKTKPTLKSRTNEVIKLYEGGKSQHKIAKELGYSSGQVSILLQKNDVEIRPINIYTVDEDYFKIIDTEKKAYILGWWYSDGNVMKDKIRISLAKKDEKIVQWIKDELKYTGPLYKKIREKPRENQVELCINRGAMANDLIKLGCVPNKSLVLRFPDWLDKDLIRHFVRGVLDGDGSINASRPNIITIFVTGSYYFVNGLVNYLPCGYTNIYQRYKQKPKEKSAHSLFIGRKEDVVKFLHWIYDDATIWLDRKYKKAKIYL